MSSRFSHSPAQRPVAKWRKDAPRTNAEAPVVQDLLEALDDAMFGAMSGDAVALELAPVLWVQAVMLLESQLVDESREQYLRFAADVTSGRQTRGIRNPDAAAAAAMDLAELLNRVA